MTSKWISKERAMNKRFGRGRAKKEIYYVEPKRTGMKKVSVERLREVGIKPPQPSIADLEKAAKTKFTSRQKELLRDLQVAGKEDLEDFVEKSPGVKRYIRWLKKKGFLE